MEIWRKLGTLFETVLLNSLNFFLFIFAEH